MYKQTSLKILFFLLVIFLLAACSAPVISITSATVQVTITLTPTTAPADLLLSQTASLSPTYTPQPTINLPATPTPESTLVPTSSPNPDFPADIYPPPLPFQKPVNGIEMSGCPDLTGVEQANDLSSQDAAEAINTLLSGDPQAFRQGSDQTYWNSSQANAPAQVPLQAKDVQANHASLAPYADLIKVGCGQETLDRSWWVEIGSGALASHFFLIDRAGHWLVWSSYP